MTADEFVQRMFVIAEELDLLYEELLTSELSEEEKTRIIREIDSVIHEAFSVRTQAAMGDSIAKEVK